jgi:hypothetical protein
MHGYAEREGQKRRRDVDLAVAAKGGEANATESERRSIGEGEPMCVLECDGAACAEC